MSKNNATKRSYPDVSPDGTDDGGDYIFRKSFTTKSGKVVYKKDGGAFKFYIKRKQ